MSKPRKFHMEPAFPPSHPGYQPGPRMGEARRPK